MEGRRWKRHKWNSNSKEFLGKISLETVNKEVANVDGNSVEEGLRVRKVIELNWEV